MQTNSKGGHFLKEDIAHFDNSFFRISDTEAKVSHRIFSFLFETEFSLPYLIFEIKFLLLKQ